MTFSQRQGLKAIRKIIQVDSMDVDLRNSLWNTLTVFYWDKLTLPGFHDLSSHSEMMWMIRSIWANHFKQALDTLNNDWPYTFNQLRKHFYKCSWNEVYDFIDFMATGPYFEQTQGSFMESCNIVLEREKSGYRFMKGEIRPFTSKEEISEIEEALNQSAQNSPVNIHLGAALASLSDRNAPDYRNSIKESISAVEAICGELTGDPKATLGQALKNIEEKSGLRLHPALKESFEKLYGYTSDADGIRHALTEESNLKFEDAKFMLVACSAFVNYLKAKTV